MNKKIIQCTGLQKTYQDGQLSVSVLKHIDFSIMAGDRMAIVGPSGSGKSTLLHLLGGLDYPTAGTVFVQGEDWQSFSEKKRCQLRNLNFGYIYQFHHLLPEFTALENVAMPLLLARISVHEAQQQATQLLVEVGLESRLHHKPAQLSGGERQRVAIARALVNNPTCVFADEPTGNLDHATAMQVFNVMLRLNEKRNTALVIVTHDRQLAKDMGHVMALQEGTLKRQ
jgi:lipoprotein-releasing system ATP-binding protein